MSSFRILTPTGAFAYRLLCCQPQRLGVAYRRLSSVPSFSAQHTIAAAENISIVIPDPPTPLDLSTSLNAIGEPTFASLGLNSFWPSGWYQYLLENIHVSLDLPWWCAIATTTLAIRLCLFPFIIKQRRELTKFTATMPQFTLLQERLTNARLSGNPVEVMRVSREMQIFMQNNDVSPLKSFKLLFIQVPIFLSVFAGLRGMAKLPVPSMQAGGLSWFTDLTVADPYYILPLVSMCTILLVFETGAEAPTQQSAPMIKTMMRAFPVFGFFMVMNMPSALLWYWTVSNTISLAQASFLRIPAVREFFRLPKVQPQQVLKSRGLVGGFKEAMNNSRLLAELDARERLDAKAWQKSGTGSVPRTFTYDPTKATSSKKAVIHTHGTVVDSDRKKAVRS